MSVFSKLKQFKDLRDQGKKMQSLVAGESATARAANDQVLVTLDGNLSLSAIAIDAEMLHPDNKTKLESAVKDAHNDALKKIQRIIAGKMQQSGEFKMPGM